MEQVLKKAQNFLKRNRPQSPQLFPLCGVKMMVQTYEKQTDPLEYHIKYYAYQKKFSSNLYKIQTCLYNHFLLLTTVLL